MSSYFGITMLGSGSGGNASVIHGPRGNLLLDAGFRAKGINERLEIVGIDLASIRAVLISHAHTDHTAGCAVFCKKDNIPVYMMPEAKLINSRNVRR